MVRELEGAPLGLVVDGDEVLWAKDPLCRIRLLLLLPPLPVNIILEGRRSSSPLRGRARLPAARIWKQRRWRKEVVVRPPLGGVLLCTHGADELLALLLRWGATAKRAPAARRGAATGG
jgi:hypothetical protein